MFLCPDVYNTSLISCSTKTEKNKVIWWLTFSNVLIAMKLLQDKICYQGENMFLEKKKKRTFGITEFCFNPVSVIYLYVTIFSKLQILSLGFLTCKLVITEPTSPVVRTKSINSQKITIYRVYSRLSTKWVSFQLVCVFS